MEDMANKAYGLSWSTFFDTIIPPPMNTPLKPTLKNNPFERLMYANATGKRKLSEAQISKRFVRPLLSMYYSFLTTPQTHAMNKNNLAPGFKVALSELHPDPSPTDPTRQKINAALFHSASVLTDGRPHWVDQLVAIEFNTHKSYKDPFTDTTATSVDDELQQERMKTRSQILSYAELLFQIQHRIALLMIIVVGRTFRIVRWDRSGTIVSDAVDYYKEWEFTCEILWRISCLSSEQLGFDPTAERLSPGSILYDRMDRAAERDESDVDHRDGHVIAEGDACSNPPVFAYIRTHFRNSLVPGWGRYRLKVTSDGGNTRSFLVSKPSFCEKGMATRGTKGFVALDCATGEFVWLKDTWRSDYPGVEQEGSALQKLNHEPVPNVPTLVCHGDIPGQSTLSPQLWHLRSCIVPISSETNIPDDRGQANSSSSKRKRDDGNGGEQSCPVATTPGAKDRNLNPDAAHAIKHSVNTALTRDDTAKSDYSSDDDLDDEVNSVHDADEERCATLDNMPAPQQPPESPSHPPQPCPLRRQTHYRMVVSEVGMPLQNFTSGLQLLSILLDCVTGTSSYPSPCDFTLTIPANSPL